MEGDSNWAQPCDAVAPPSHLLSPPSGRHSKRVLPTFKSPSLRQLRVLLRYVQLPPSLAPRIIQSTQPQEPRKQLPVPTWIEREPNIPSRIVPA